MGRDLAHAQVRERIQERKRQAVERGLLAAVWDILGEAALDAPLIWAHGDLEIVQLPGGVIEVRSMGRAVLRAAGLEPEAVYLYLPGAIGWEESLRAWASSARYAKASRSLRALTETERDWIYGIADRWGLAPDGSDLTTGVS